jgi:hypothetical protein
VTINAQNLSSKFKVESASAFEKALSHTGLAVDRFIIGRDGATGSGFEAGVYCTPDGHNHYWLRNEGTLVEYLDQWPSTDFSAVAIPFFLADFRLTQVELLDRSARLQDVQQQLRTMQLAVTVMGPGTAMPDEGYYLVSRATRISMYFTERGQSRQLAETTFPWVAGLFVAWIENYKKLRYS